MDTTVFTVVDFLCREHDANASLLAETVDLDIGVDNRVMESLTKDLLLINNTLAAFPGLDSRWLGRRKTEADRTGLVRKLGTVPAILVNNALSGQREGNELVWINMAFLWTCRY